MSEELTVADYEVVLAEHRQLVRRLDVALNGEDGAARQASLCDIIGQIETGIAIRFDSAADEIVRLRKALETIESGTEDIFPPFRSMPASSMQNIARIALKF